MTKFDLIIDLHRNSERQGPGSEKDTLKALGFIKLPPGKLKVADLGCGSGGQTISLAKKLNSEITAIDLFPEFLQDLNEKSEKLGLKSKIKTISVSMEDLPFEKESFDIIWSEGAIYNIGFEKGIKSWLPYLKSGGYLAVSEITWITNSRPEAIEAFWTREYPEIAVASTKINQLESNGYSLVGYFYLDEESWIKTYYEPLTNRFKDFLSRNGNTKTAQQVVEEYQTEMELYHKYKAYFSYGFYIAQKNEN